MPPQRPNLAARIGKRGPFASPEQETYLNLVRAHARLAAPIDRLLKQHGVSQPLYNILRILGGHLRRAGDDHRGLPVLRIGQDMVTREPDMTRLIDRLEKAGHVARCRCETDRRVVYVRITRSGLDLIERLGPEVDAIHRAQFTGLSRDEVAMLNDLLFRAAEQQEERRPASPTP